MYKNKFHFKNIIQNAGKFFFILCLLIFSINSEAGLKIYLIRHAEAGHNVVNDWKDVPKDQWPAYVGNSNMLTPKGELQKMAAAEKLKQYHFDFIAVSPARRTQQTILPYLKQMSVKGEIWPELNENGTIATFILSPSLPSPSQKILNAGDPIQIPSEDSAYFLIREDGKYKTRISQSQEIMGYNADVKFVLKNATERIKKKFGGTEKSILLVSHGNAGIDLLKLLVNDNLEKVSSIKNTAIWMVEEQPNGTFKLKIYNDEPIKE